MANVLLLFAHPALQKSRVHSRLLRRIPERPDVTLHDLYEAYPDFLVDVAREQELLLAHDVIVFQHPFYWYSVPPLLKQWIDLVLEHGWAYGSEGTALRGKRLLNILTAGGKAEAYCSEGRNHLTVRELLAPIEQTAGLCGMRFVPPWVIYGTHGLDSQGIEAYADRYAHLLNWLADVGLVEFDATATDLIVPARAEAET